MLLLWLSIACMIPFDLNRLDTMTDGAKSVMDQILQLSQVNLFFLLTISFLFSSIDVFSHCNYSVLPSSLYLSFFHFHPLLLLFPSLSQQLNLSLHFLFFFFQLLFSFLLLLFFSFHVFFFLLDPTADEIFLLC